MTTVDISAGGRQVVIEAPDADPAKLAATALKIWRATEGAKPPTRIEAGGLGFHLERADEP